MTSFQLRAHPPTHPPVNIHQCTTLLLTPLQHSLLAPVCCRISSRALERCAPLANAVPASDSATHSRPVTGQKTSRAMPPPPPPRPRLHLQPPSLHRHLSSSHPLHPRLSSYLHPHPRRSHLPRLPPPIPILQSSAARKAPMAPLQTPPAAAWASTPVPAAVRGILIVQWGQPSVTASRWGGGTATSTCVYHALLCIGGLPAIIAYLELSYSYLWAHLYFDIPAC